MTPIVQSDTTGEKESAAGEDESGNAGKVIVGKDDEGDDDAGKEIAGEDDGGKDAAGKDAAGKNAAGKDAAGNDAAGKDGAGKDSAGKADSGQDGAGNANISSPDSDDVLKNPRKRTISKTALDGVSNASKTSGNSYHFIIFI